MIGHLKLKACAQSELIEISNCRSSSLHASIWPKWTSRSLSSRFRNTTKIGSP